MGFLRILPPDKPTVDHLIAALADKQLFKAAADSKREEFRKYLEKAGVMDVLTKVLVGLYEEPEKPNNALDFLRQHLGASGPETADVEALKLEVTELRQKLEKLTEENAELKLKLSEYEPAGNEMAAEN